MRDLVDDCVHCGFCLPACPTYTSWSQEMDSPRGRIFLMKGLRDGELAWSPSLAAHFDRCLGCMACVSACPSGVRYDVLIERTRAAREGAVPRTRPEALFRAAVFALFPRPGPLRVAALLLWAYSLLGLRWLARKTKLLERVAPRVARLEALAPERPIDALLRALPRRVVAQGERRARVGLVAGCVQRVYFSGVHAATLRVLAGEGCEVVVPRAQGCCGALSLHAGRPVEAAAFARGLIRRFEEAEVDAVIVNSAGCGSALKEYGRLLEHDPAWGERARRFAAKVRDVCEFVSALPARAVRHPIAERVAYHDACHLAHAQGIRRAPRALLESVPGLSVQDVGGDGCCGSAGVYNLLQPASADQIGARKVAHILRTQARVVVSANPGCALHLERLLRDRGVALSIFHPIEVLDRALRGQPLTPTVGGSR